MDVSWRSSVPSADEVAESLARLHAARDAEGLVSLHTFVAEFVRHPKQLTDAEVEEAIDALVDRVREVATISHIEILGEGYHGVAGAIDAVRVLKLTRDKSEVAVATVLEGRRFAHVIEVFAARRLFGWQPRFPEREAGLLISERVVGLTEADAPDLKAIHEAVRDFDEVLSPRAKSMRVEAMLRQAGSPACLDVAAALRELWTVGAYTSDVRPENVGRARNGAYKLLDLGAACVEGAAKAAEEQQAGSRRKMGPMTVAQVAYEDATSPFYTRVSSCLLSLGSVDPDEDIGRMPPGYVANAESAGMDPGVVAATIYTSTHHLHPVVAVGVAAETASASSGRGAAEETYRVEYTNTRGKQQKAYVQASSQVEAVSKAAADAQSRGTDIDRRHAVKSTPDRKIRLVAEAPAARAPVAAAPAVAASEERPGAPGYYAMWPDGRILSGPYANRYQAAPDAQRVNGFVQFEAGEARAPAPVAAAEAPRRKTHEDVEAALYQDKVYRKLAAQYYRAEPGSPQAAALGAKLERRRTELLVDPEFKVAEPVTAAVPSANPVAPVGVGLAAEEDCSCKGMLAAEEGVAAEKPRTLRWHRTETEGKYEAAGVLGKYEVVKRTPDRRHGVLPHALLLNGAPVSQFNTKGDAQDFAASYDAILPFVAPRGTPVEVSPEGRALIGGKSIVDACLPWVHVTRDVEKLNACKATGKRVDGPREVYDLLVPYLSTSDQEVFLVVLLDVKNQLRGVAEVARGQRSKVVVDPVDILRPVIITGASSYYVAHCHPSGDATPSGADKRLTRAIEKASKIAAPDVAFAGHYVIVDGAYADAVSGKVTKIR